MRHCTGCLAELLCTQLFGLDLAGSVPPWQNTQQASQPQTPARKAAHSLSQQNFHSWRRGILKAFSWRINSYNWYYVEENFIDKGAFQGEDLSSMWGVWDHAAFLPFPHWKSIPQKDSMSAKASFPEMLVFYVKGLFWRGRFKHMRSHIILFRSTTSVSMWKKKSLSLLPTERGCAHVSKKKSQ